MKEKICGIYKITSPSGRIYVGKSVDIVARGRRYKNYDCKNQVLLLRSLLKYKWEAHLFEVIEECERDELSCRERYWQDFYDVIGKMGLNCALESCGDTKKVLSEYTINNLKEACKSKESLSEEVRKKIGESNKGQKRTEETKKKMSEAKKGKYEGENNPNFGKKRTKETNEKILSKRRSFKGELNPNFGKPMSQEQKDKISKTRIENNTSKGENHPNFGKKLSKEHKNNIGKSNKGKRTYSNSPHAKQVLDIVTNITYGSIRELLETLSITDYQFKKLTKGDKPRFILL